MTRIFVSCVLLLSLVACNTVQGIGKDLKKGGEAVEKAAK